MSDNPAKVRELLTKLTTPQGRSEFVADPAGVLKAHGIEPPTDLPVPQADSDLATIEEYERALEALGADRFGQDYTSLDSPDLAAFMIWLRALPPEQLR